MAHYSLPKLFPILMRLKFRISIFITNTIYLQNLIFTIHSSKNTAQSASRILKLLLRKIIENNLWQRAILQKSLMLFVLLYLSIKLSIKGASYCFSYPGRTCGSIGSVKSMGINWIISHWARENWSKENLLVVRSSPSQTLEIFPTLIPYFVQFLP